ncbi:MAG TPA: BON domain-containing protein [Candidatus Limnocylindrales bacterium]|nr:BON domain-containing protein [Candidatus Limnocylindrales bacterium]
MSHERDVLPSTPSDPIAPDDLPGSGVDELPRAAGRDEVDPVSEVVPDPDVRSLAGFRDAEDEGDPLGRDEVDDLGSITDVEIYEGELEARVPYIDQPDEPVAENLEMLIEREMRAGETANADVAAEEGEVWVPPTDPPVVPGDEAQPVVAAGFGTTSVEEPFDADHHQDSVMPEDERTERVVEALRADASTSFLADRLSVDTDGGLVLITGEVDDLDDEDNVLAVASTAAGVTEVVSRIRVRSVE